MQLAEPNAQRTVLSRSMLRVKNAPGWSAASPCAEAYAHGPSPALVPRLASASRRYAERKMSLQLLLAR